MDGINVVLDFWFGQDVGGVVDDARTAKSQAKLWWSKSEALDTSIRDQFADLNAQAMRGELDGWQHTAEGRLALIILCDQFPRNMYRATPESFACDARARAYTEAGLTVQADRQLRPIQRVFFYLPLEHSEALADQDRAVALYDALRKDVPETQHEIFEGYYQYAIRHREVIQRFGRFPHRNAILGRTSTAEEVQFLSLPGSSF
ncbi:DUF924 domain-containing protein [Undibacterium sp. CY18W]|uniref:DUF924 domain-containing protein n=1 Tax=Undibacterium hunanense TaxID=2762292 RepID=A0ABR6ZV29_9BURK|nr:DUF924 family protein [Undibacterium hunanense]MBC3919715.1 DUF924 domain-containing protein [Undibacterium hunanense]